MTLIEGIGDEVIQCFVALFFIVIVALAWYTTNISNEGTFRTVFLLERRRLRITRRLTNYTEASTIAEGTTAEPSENDQPEPAMEEVKPSENSSAGAGDSGDNQTNQAIDEETRIVEAMDAPRDSQDSDNLRRRRLAFYTKSADDTASTPYNSPNLSRSSDEVRSDAECTGAWHECPATDSENTSNSSSNKKDAGDLEPVDRICVKLMFLNDELRQVDGRLQEKIGDFKRRHFQDELAANKVVKLIFNGHVLQQDDDTLQSCGLFDNCVVHCLVHQRTNSPSQSVLFGNRENNSTPLSINIRTNNNNPPYEWHLENYLFAILCCFLGFAWYLRYVYAHLYTVTATIGLILMTGIFSIIMFGMHFPDNVELNQQRTENIRSHQ